ncbi:murein L,D-transpeptidase catalytic domain family protein [Flavobacterium sp.]
MKYKIFSLFALLLLTSFSSLPSKNFETKITTIKANNSLSKVESIYLNLKSNACALPSFDCFSIALEGFNKFKEKGIFKKNILTLIDFSKSSNSKRLWIIDLDSDEVLLNTYVAHGRNTGNEFADKFSNKAESFQSSLGFYATAEIYNGKHGSSLKLDGLQKGMNDNARERAVVMHGADYVSEKFIKNNKRLGRSLGCPAVPEELNDKIITLIKDKSCLFIYHPSRKDKFI